MNAAMKRPGLALLGVILAALILTPVVDAQNSEPRAYLHRLEDGRHCVTAPGEWRGCRPCTLEGVECRNLLSSAEAESPRPIRVGTLHTFSEGDGFSSQVSFRPLVDQSSLADWQDPANDAGQIDPIDPVEPVVSADPIINPVDEVDTPDQADSDQAIDDTERGGPGVTEEQTPTEQVGHTDPVGHRRDFSIVDRQGHRHQVAFWAPGGPTSWRLDGSEYDRAGKSVWDIPPLGLWRPPNRERMEPVERVLACWAKGADLPHEMWHCSGHFVNHDVFATCMSGGYCLPPSIVPVDIRIAGLPLAGYALTDGQRFAHIDRTRSNAEACRTDGQSVEAFAECFVPRQVPRLEAFALLCAQAYARLDRSTHLAAGDWIRICVQHADKNTASLPEALAPCASEVTDSMSFRTCIERESIALATPLCEAFVAGDGALMLPCIAEERVREVRERPELECLAKAARTQAFDVWGCLHENRIFPESVKIQLIACRFENQTPACMASSLLNQDLEVESVRDGLIEHVAASTKIDHAILDGCLRRADGSVSTECTEALMKAHPLADGAKARCLREAESTKVRDCVVSEVAKATSSPLLSCLVAENAERCVGTVVLGPHGAAIVDCAGEKQGAGSGCLRRFGFSDSEELDRAWECRFADSEEGAWSCLAGAMLGDNERKALACAQDATNDEEAFTCIAATQLGEDERRLLECSRVGDSAQEHFACAVGSAMLGENEARALNCAMDTQDVTGAAVCYASDDLTAEQRIAVSCAVETAGNAYAWAACTGGKLFVREMGKCLSGGIGTQDGCFGESNDLRRAVETAFKDLTEGPGANNDLVRLASDLEEALAQAAQDLANLPENVLRTAEDALVVVMEAGQEAGNAVLEAWQDVCGDFCS